MFFFFGSRATTIGTQRVNQSTECPYCHTRDSFVMTTFGRYAHFFWIPILPIGNKTVVECTHCKRTYAENELSLDLKQSVVQQKAVTPATSPFWHFSGLLLVGAFICFGSIMAALAPAKSGNVEEAEDKLRADLQKVTATPNPNSDQLAYALKSCVSESLTGVDTDRIRYYTQTDGDKVLILLQVTDMKAVEKSSRKEVILAVEDCFNELKPDGIDKAYIGVNGNFNMLLVKTPTADDFDGKYADESLLLPFYSAQKTLPSSPE